VEHYGRQTLPLDAKWSFLVPLLKISSIAYKAEPLVCSGILSKAG
jgi:hypothetical protein